MLTSHFSFVYTHLIPSSLFSYTFGLIFFLRYYTIFFIIFNWLISLLQLSFYSYPFYLFFYPFVSYLWIFTQLSFPRSELRIRKLLLKHILSPQIPRLFPLPSEVFLPFLHLFPQRSFLPLTFKKRT